MSRQRSGDDLRYAAQVLSDELDAIVDRRSDQGKEVGDRWKAERKKHTQWLIGHLRTMARNRDPRSRGLIEE